MLKILKILRFPVLNGADWGCFGRIEKHGVDKMKWIATNPGDKQQSRICSRLVERERNSWTRLRDSTAPWNYSSALAPPVVTRRETCKGTHFRLAFCDIRWALVYGDSDRELSVTFAVRIVAV